MICFLKIWIYGHIIMKYNRIKRFIKNGFKEPDVSNYGWGIPYDPVEDWFKIYHGALSAYKREIKDNKKIIKNNKKIIKKNQKIIKALHKLKDFKQEKLDMINNLYNQGISLNVIANASNLSIAEVEKIVKK